MSWIEMNVAQTNRSGGKVFSFEQFSELLQAGDTPDILIPDIQSTITITVEPSNGAEVTVFSTTAPVEDIKSGSPSVIWLEWGRGNTTVAVGSAFNPVSAIKMRQNNAGTSRITLRAQ